VCSAETDSSSWAAGQYGHVWHAKAWGTPRPYSMGAGVTAWLVSSDVLTLCAGLTDGTIRRIYVTTNPRRRPVRAAHGAVTALAVRPTARSPLRGRGSDAALWQVPTRKVLQSFTGLQSG